MQKRAVCAQGSISTLILTDNKLTGPSETLRSLTRARGRGGDGDESPPRAAESRETHLTSGAEAAAAIIKQHAGHIKRLDLSENPLGPTGCEVLARTFRNSTPHTLSPIDPREALSTHACLVKKPCLSKDKPCREIDPRLMMGGWRAQAARRWRSRC